MFVIYSHVCAPCKYRSRIRIVNSLARAAGQEVSIVETIGRPDLLDQAKSLSDVDMPFVYNTDNKHAISLDHIRLDSEL